MAMVRFMLLILCKKHRNLSHSTLQGRVPIHTHHSHIFPGVLITRCLIAVFAD